LISVRIAEVGVQANQTSEMVGYSARQIIVAWSECSHVQYPA
jgi:hypothetical protein